MYEENRKFSLTNFFIKAIIVIIFVLFTVWLLSLSNKGISNSLDVLTDNIFAENLDRMKEVGKSYFTTERLPQKVGDIKTLTLQKMYDEHLILPVKDKNGKLCSAKDSYVSIEKMENEYQMKVYLECGDESEYIIVIMGCYDYCDTDICEVKEPTEVKDVEYEYKKTTGGYWTNYGAWSEWSKVSVTGTNYRQVETKVVDEEYTYDKVVTNTLYSDYKVSCPLEYALNSEGTRCFKNIVRVETSNPVCPVIDGYKVTRNGFTCNYSKETTTNADPVCPAPSDGYKLIGRNGFTCNYSKSVQTSYQVPVTSPKTCYRQQIVMSCAGCAPVIQNIPYTCGTETTYVTKYKTETVTDSKDATCPTGYSKSGNSCIKNVVDNKTTTASCPTGYSKSGNNCVKNIFNTLYEDIIKSCESGYTLTTDGTKCYKTESSTVKVTDTKKVTYYRYRIREYVGGTTDYKWSKSKEDKTLLNAGYKLTGRTR